MSQKVQGREGFSIVELIVALVILSLGLLSLAATSGYLAANIRVADLRTQRSAAIQHSIEELRAMPFDNIAKLNQGSARRVGEFDVWWDVTDVNNNLKTVSIISELAVPAAKVAQGAAARDTFVLNIVRP